MNLTHRVEACFLYYKICENVSIRMVMKTSTAFFVSDEE